MKKNANNRGTKALRGQSAFIDDSRSKQVVIGEYCEIATRCKITRLASPEDKPYKTIPTGYGYGF